MILLIDNYDSFTYNLYQYIGIFNSDIRVVRNDKITIDEIKKLLNDNEFVKVKIIIDDNTDASYLISYLNELYRNNSSVKIEIENHYEFKQEAAVDKLMEQVSDKYDFLRDSSISHEEKIQKFIKMKHDKDIPLEVIRNVLNLN